jgi:hypothetical protein
MAERASRSKDRAVRLTNGQLPFTELQAFFGEQLLPMTLWAAFASA